MKRGLLLGLALVGAACNITVQKRSNDDGEREETQREQRQTRYYKYHYDEAYPDLPNYGEADQWFGNLGHDTQVPRGYFNGDVKFQGNGLVRSGEGPGNSVIDGDVEIRGNGWCLENMTITGELKVRGNNNQFNNVQIFGDIDVSGQGNTIPPRSNPPVPPGSEPAPASDSGSGSGGRYYVGGYRPCYPNLPDYGEADEWCGNLGRNTSVDQGYFRGDVKFQGNGLVRSGQGAGNSVIDGHVEIRGNGWCLENMTITGSLKIRGNNNILNNVEIFGDIDVSGQGNTIPPRSNPPRR